MQRGLVKTQRLNQTRRWLSIKLLNKDNLAFKDTQTHET